MPLIPGRQVTAMRQLAIGKNWETINEQADDDDADADEKLVGIINLFDERIK